MNKKQIAALDAAAVPVPSNPRLDWWHYRFTKATRYSPGVWQFSDRSKDTGWEQVERPSDEVLARLIVKGNLTNQGVRWKGFHDPQEYEKGN